MKKKHKFTSGKAGRRAFERGTVHRTLGASLVPQPPPPPPTGAPSPRRLEESRGEAVVGGEGVGQGEVGGRGGVLPHCVTPLQGAFALSPNLKKVNVLLFFILI